MKFDDIIIKVGEFGPYQQKLYFLVCLIAIPAAINQLIQVFLAGVPDHWCVSPELASLNCSSWPDYSDSTQCDLEKKEASIPMEGGEFAQCERYNLTGVPFYPGVNISDDTQTLDCDAGWIYDKSQYKSSIVSDFNLVCNKKSLPDLAQSVYFAGLLVGSLLWGALADKIGRYPSFFLCVFFEIITGVSVAFSPTFTAYIILRFLLAINNMGLFIIAFVIGTEFVGPSKRVLAGIGIQFFFAVGYMVLALLAFLIREWWILQLVCIGPIVLFLFLIPVLTESPRWLMARGKYAEAEKIIMKVAEVNNKKLPVPLFNEIEVQEHLKELGTVRQPSVFDLFRTPRLRKNTLNMLWSWCVTSMVYYGLSLSTGDLGGNAYVSFFLSGLVEVPAYLYVLFALDWFGRRLNLAGTFFVGGIACFLTTFVPLGVWRTTVAMIGKFCIAATFAIIYIYAAELFPTPVRSIGMGISSSAARVGGIVAPLLLVLGDLWEPLPQVVFGACSIIAGALALFLPETTGKNLPETIEEGENFGKKTDETKPPIEVLELPSNHIESREVGTDNPAFEKV